MEVVEGLQRLGINRNVAKLITYLKDVDECSSKDIEIATGMRQPEVSIAMRPLREQGWISERDVRNPGMGKGRPKKFFSLSTTIEEIIGHFEAEKNQESTRTSEAIQKLKELSPAL
jgi:predicted transcriptional regulator